MKPILFNTEMVRAIQDGRKTVTRRVVKPQPDGRPVPMTKDSCWPGYFAIQGTEKVVRLPYQPGDILYVRETWTKLWYVDPDGYTHYDQPMYYYAADGAPDITIVDEEGFEKDDQRIRWHPSIHMPKEAARLFLRVTDVRVERLQDITPAQIDAEGCNEFAYSAKTGEPLPSGPSWFKTAWDKTVPKHPNKFKRYPYYWSDNPWVWVIEFERISNQPEGETDG